jgi:hypothetical protein
MSEGTIIRMLGEEVVQAASNDLGGLHHKGQYHLKLLLRLLPVGATEVEASKVVEITSL